MPEMKDLVRVVLRKLYVSDTPLKLINLALEAPRPEMSDLIKTCNKKVICFLDGAQMKKSCLRGSEARTVRFDEEIY